MLVMVGLGALSAYQPKTTLLLVAGLPLGLALIAWPEVTLGLYASAGLFKADPRLSGLTGSIDITLALGAVLAATVAYRLVLRRERITWNRETCLVLVFAGVILIGLVYTPAHTYGTDKAFHFVSLTMLAFFTPLVFIKSSRSVWLFFLGWLGLATLMTIDALGRLSSGQRLSALNATTIATGRTIGVAIIILLFAVLMGRVSRLWQILAAAGLGPMLLVIVGTGSRGPTLMLVAAVTLTFCLTLAKPRRCVHSLLIIGLVGAAVLGVFASGLMPRSSIQRFGSLFNQVDMDTSVQGRLLVMEVAWHLFTSSPIVGRGTGSVSAFGAGQEQVYPHNILLELAAETGLLGLGLFLGVVEMVLWRLLASLSKESGQEPLLLTLLTMLVFTLLNAMVSGDLNDGRTMWLFAGIAIATTEIEGEMAP